MCTILVQKISFFQLLPIRKGTSLFHFPFHSLFHSHFNFPFNFHFNFHFLTLPLSLPFNLPVAIFLIIFSSFSFYFHFFIYICGVIRAEWSCATLIRTGQESVFCFHPCVRNRQFHNTHRRMKTTKTLICWYMLQCVPHAVLYI